MGIDKSPALEVEVAADPARLEAQLAKELVGRVGADRLDPDLVQTEVGESVDKEQLERLAAVALLVVLGADIHRQLRPPADKVDGGEPTDAHRDKVAVDPPHDDVHLDGRVGALAGEPSLLLDVRDEVVLATVAPDPVVVPPLPELLEVGPANGGEFQTEVHFHACLCSCSGICSLTCWANGELGRSPSSLTSPRPILARMAFIEFMAFFASSMQG